MLTELGHLESVYIWNDSINFRGMRLPGIGEAVMSNIYLELFTKDRMPNLRHLALPRRSQFVESWWQRAESMFEGRLQLEKERFD
jgi:hypothetical protein